ncbi:hypothetical protein [Deinococcus sp. UYEF24]
MIIKSQAMRLLDVICRLEDCINAIMSTGDLNEWMSPDGIALLKSTELDIKERKPGLECLINTPPSLIEAHFNERDLENQIQSYASLLFHLTGTLQVAINRK